MRRRANAGPPEAGRCASGKAGRLVADSAVSIMKKIC